MVGCGPAGLGTALYLARAKLNVKVFGFVRKSKLFKAHLVQNYLGFPDGIGGKSLMENSVLQLKSFGVEIEEKEIVSILRKDGFFVVKTDSMEEFESKNIVLASGLSFKSSGIKNEDSLVGKGVHYCVLCDGFFYSGKKIAVVGNANYAAEEALQLMAFSRNVSIFSNGETFAFSKELEKLLADAKIVLRSEKILEFEKTGNGLKLLFDSEKFEEFDAVFIALGNAGALSFARNLGLELNGNGAIKVDFDGRTNLKGVFAVGDCTGSISQVSFAAGMGCAVAFSIIKSMAGKKVYIDYG